MGDPGGICGQRPVFYRPGQHSGGIPPLWGKGAEAARYDIVFEDGGVQSVPLRNGIEFASAFGLAGPSRIDPRARRATRTLAVSYDLNWEVYYLNTLRVEIPGNRPGPVCPDPASS